MRFAEIVKLLAAPFSVQEAFLGDIPRDTAVSNFTIYNDIYRMAQLYRCSTGVHEGDGGSEGLEHWQARTQIPENYSIVFAEYLSIAMHMLLALDKPFLYTRHGLRSGVEWRLIRHLASQVCDAMGWPRELEYTNFETLWNELGDGVIDAGD